MLNEQQLEDLCIGWFQQTGWQFAHGPDIAPEGGRPERADFRQMILRDRLLAALARINPEIPAAALEQAAHTLQTVSEPMLVVRNRAVHRLLLGGVDVSFAKADGEGKTSDLVSLIDFAQPSNNEFLVVNQFTVSGTKQPRRPDLVVFVNGLPLAVIELKNPANEHTGIWDAFNQLQTYKNETADLFNCNVALVISDGFTARVGSLTADVERMLPWRTITNENDRPRLQMELETLVRGFFKPELFLDYVRHFVLYEHDGDAIIKKIAGYHQFHAVREAVRATVIAAQDADKGLLEVREERATYGQEVKPRAHNNVVQEKKYGDRLLETLRKYHNRAVETAQVIEELIQMAKEFQSVLEREAALGLSPDEIAFYDALANNESAVRELGDDILKKIAVEITEKLRASTTVDWQVRESVRARLRILVRRTLQKWKFPPDQQPEAVELILKQAESLSDQWTH